MLSVAAVVVAISGGWWRRRCSLARRAWRRCRRATSKRVRRTRRGMPRPRPNLVPIADQSAVVDVLEEEVLEGG